MITATKLAALMYDLPVLIAATRSRRKLSLHTAAKNIGISVATVYRVESTGSCDVQTLIRILRWLEND